MSDLSDLRKSINGSLTRLREAVKDQDVTAISQVNRFLQPELKRYQEAIRAKVVQHERVR